MHLNHKEERISFLSVIFLGIVTLFGQIQNDVLRAVDAPCYALMGKELAGRPYSEWVSLTLNGKPFFEHPHFTPWILGLSIKLFGVGTLQVLLPIVILSLLTAVLAYFIGRLLHGHLYGMLTAFVLALTPAFIKDGRNPMLEPALMFTIMLALYFHLRFLVDTTKLRYSFFTGGALGLALLAKGPPALLVLAVMIGFWVCSYFLGDSFSRFRVSFKLFSIHLFLSLSVASSLLLLIDLWSVAKTGESFFLKYADTQLQSTVMHARGASANVWDFYRPNFFKYYPWIYFIYLSLPLLFWKKRKEFYPAFVFSGLVTGGIFLGFTLMKHKGYWYPNIHYVSSSLIAAIPLCILLSEKKWMKFFPHFCFGVGTSVLFLGAAFPSLFIYPRPVEQLLERAGREAHETLRDQKIGSCVDLNGWRGTFLMQFYLDAKMVPCEEEGTSFQMVDLKACPLPPETRVLVTESSLAIIKK